VRTRRTPQVSEQSRVWDAPEETIGRDRVLARVVLKDASGERIERIAFPSPGSFS